MRDERSITIGAPDASGSLRPPERRAPEIVEPAEPDPVAAPATPAGTERPDATQAVPVSEAPVTDGAGDPSADVRRIVVPAPGAAPAPAPTGPKAPPEPPEASPRTGWRRYLPPKRVVLAVVVVVALLGGGTLLWAYQKFQSIERVDLTPVLATDDGTNYLIVGSDTREGVDPDDPNAGAILGDDTVGGPERSDTILILRIDGEGARMLSVPRDLFLTISETGERSRINTAFNGGPGRLIATLRDQLDLPVHHYLQLDFVSFSGMVDALGGITIEFEHPAFDTQSGLNVPEAGPQTLDGTQALAYVRSRFYTEVIDGREVRQGNGDIGRVERQQRFLSAVTSAIGDERNPFALARIADQLADGMRIDDDLTFLEALNLLRRMRGLEPQPTAMPTANFRTSAGAAVLRLVQPGADEVLAQFGSGGSKIG